MVTHGEHCGEIKTSLLWSFGHICPLGFAIQGVLRQGFITPYNHLGSQTLTLKSIGLQIRLDGDHLLLTLSKPTAFRLYYIIATSSISKMSVE